MSPLTKVFIILIVVLSIAFSMMSIQFATSTARYKDLADDYKQDFETLQQSSSAVQLQAEAAQLHLQNEISRLNDQISAMESQLAEAKAAQERAVAKVADCEQRATLLNSKNSTAIETLKLNSQELAQLRANNESMMSDNVQLQKENADLALRVNELTTQVAVGEETIRMLKEKNYQLSQSLEKIQNQLQALQPGMATGGPVEIIEDVTAADAGARPSPIYGRITEVRDSMQMASISVGSADGVREGMDFTIYRGDNYLGTLRVTHVREEQAAGRIKITQGQIQTGDSVADRFEK